jgi:hypothetical protein
LRDVVGVTDGNGSGHSGHGLKREGKEEINRELSPLFQEEINRELSPLLRCREFRRRNVSAD